jgi:RHS repeat-associated protein
VPRIPGEGAFSSLTQTSTHSEACTYSHDDLGRLISGNCGSVWAQTFTYDAFGNITKTGSESFQPMYSPTTNQISTIGSFTPSYDANGDVLNDSLHTYAWDSLGRPTTIDSVTVTYDALGRMVEQDKSGSYTQIVYDPLGNKLALMSTTTTLTEAFAPLPAGATAVYTSSSLGTTNKVAYYRHPDWMGSSRFSSTPTRTMYNDLAYAPFGEQYATSGTTGVANTSFAGNNGDTTTNLYDAYFREYGIQGRWPSPDPAGMAAANPANPQSWNRYAYVLNSPLNSTDPSGLMSMPCREANKPPCINTVAGGIGSDDDDGFDDFGDTFGCDSIGDAIDPSGGCGQALNWFATPNWMPWNIVYNGAINGVTYTNATFGTWSDYFNFLTTAAAGGPDPCVFSNGGNVNVSVNNSMNLQQCQQAGGQWVPPGVNYVVSPNGVVQTDAEDEQAIAVAQSGAMAGNYLSCVGSNAFGLGGTGGAVVGAGLQKVLPFSFLKPAGWVAGAYIGYWIGGFYGITHC